MCFCANICIILNQMLNKVLDNFVSIVNYCVTFQLNFGCLYLKNVLSCTVEPIFKFLKLIRCQFIDGH